MNPGGIPAPKLALFKGGIIGGGVVDEVEPRAGVVVTTTVPGVNRSDMDAAAPAPLTLVGVVVTNKGVDDTPAVGSLPTIREDKGIVLNESDCCCCC